MKEQVVLKNINDFENKSLLIVDDDNPFRERLARAMEKKGFKVTQADSIASGLYAGSYNKNQTVPDPNCVENGGILSGPRCKFLYGERFNIVNDEDHLKGYLHFTRSTSKIDYSATLLMAKINVNDNPQSPSYPALSYLSKKILPGQGGSPFNVPVIWYGRPLGSAFPSPNSPKAISQYHFSNRLILDISY